MLGIACVREREPRARPETSGRTGCAVSAAAFWSRINDAKSETAGKQRNRAGIITLVHIKSSTLVMTSQFRFRDFWRSVEGSIWRVVRTTTPFLESPDTSASNAFTILV